MQVVIDMPDHIYNILKDDKSLISNVDHLVIVFKELVKKGIPLPKGHGRLVDADAILEDPYGNTYKDIEIAETIIEADEVKSE